MNLPPVVYPSDYFASVENFPFHEYFFENSQINENNAAENSEPVWAVLDKISGFFDNYKSKNKAAIHPEAKISESADIGEFAWIGAGTVVEAGAHIKGPAWIGANCTIRSGAYIRENSIIGDNSTIGNSCEVKNSLLATHCEVPHFNYVGDAVLGHRAHLGAGVILSNVKLDRSEISVVNPGDNSRIPTGRRKFSAVIGDHSEIGCNSVINPGSMIGARAIVYPCSVWSGMLAEKCIVKTRQNQIIEPRRDI